MVKQINFTFKKSTFAYENTLLSQYNYDKKNNDIFPTQICRKINRFYNTVESFLFSGANVLGYRNVPRSFIWSVALQRKTILYSVKRSWRCKFISQGNPRNS